MFKAFNTFFSAIATLFTGVNHGAQAFTNVMIILDVESENLQKQLNLESQARMERLAKDTEALLNG